MTSHTYFHLDLVYKLDAPWFYIDSFTSLATEVFCAMEPAPSSMLDDFGSVVKYSSPSLFLSFLDRYITKGL